MSDAARQAFDIVRPLLPLGSRPILPDPTAHELSEARLSDEQRRGPREALALLVPVDAWDRRVIETLTRALDGSFPAILDVGGDPGETTGRAARLGGSAQARAGASKLQTALGIMWVRLVLALVAALVLLSAPQVPSTTSVYCPGLDGLGLGAPDPVSTGPCAPPPTVDLAAELRPFAIAGLVYVLFSLALTLGVIGRRRWARVGAVLMAVADAVLAVIAALSGSPLSLVALALDVVVLRYLLWDEDVDLAFTLARGVAAPRKTLIPLDELAATKPR